MGVKQKHSETTLANRAAYNREWRARNKDKSAEYSARWREKNPGYNRQWRDLNPERVKAYTSKWRENNPAAAKAGDLKRRYGISLEQYEQMYAAQSGRCAICKTSHATLCVDHDHQSGTVRELLCNKCNRFLGGLEPNWDAAVDYLGRYRAGPATEEEINP